MRRILVTLITAWSLALSFGSAHAAEPTRGGALQSLLWPEPPGIMAGQFLQSPALLVSTKMFESLLMYDFELQPKPHLAESWKVSPDGKTYSFKLRQDVKWHDGKPLTADDVVFTFGEYLIEVHPRMKIVFQDVQVVKVDDHNVEFRLKEPFGPLIRSFGIGTEIVPAHLYKGTDFRKNPNNAKPVGTGPFKFKEWRRGEYLHLTRNENYWRKGMPYLDEIYYRLVPDAASRAIAIESQQLHLGTQNDLELLDVNRLSKMPFIDVTTKGWDVKDAAGLIAELKANPGKYHYGSNGVGLTSHLAGANFVQRTGTNAIHVPYRGGAQVYAALIAGEIQFSHEVAGTLKPMHDAGQIRCLFVASGPSLLYLTTGACRATPFVFPNHLMARVEDGALPVDSHAEMRRILASRPSVIVFDRRPNSEHRNNANADMLRSALASDYRSAGRLPQHLDDIGRDYEVWVRRSR